MRMFNMTYINELAQIRQNYLALGCYDMAETIREIIEAELKKLSDSADE